MGKLIVIDGLDGSGKATQAQLLYDRLKYMGKNVHKVSFPDYSSESSRAVKMYLNGELGDNPSELNPYMCSLLYTIDRAIQFNKRINSIYQEEDSIIICDRYLSANIIHQGGKIENVEEKRRLFEWVYDTEVKKVGLPLEDVTIVLSLPVEISQKLMLKRYDNHSEKRDIHESDIKYLKQCYNTVDIAVEHLNKLGYNWIKLDCSADGDIDSIENIESNIWDIVNSIV